MLAHLRNEIKKLADPIRAKHLQKYFKTGVGEYGAGDKFVGLTVPQNRRLAKQYKTLRLADVEGLLQSSIHEERQIALFILEHKYKKNPEQVYHLFVKNMGHINNWDLIDGFSEVIVGQYLADKPKDTLFDWARSSSVWSRRIAIMATFGYIKSGDPKVTLKIAKMLLRDEHDLIHKAVGWMLREIGEKCSREEEEEFLRQHYKTMPRTMLRYAIEKFPEAQRKRYLSGVI